MKRAFILVFLFLQVGFLFASTSLETFLSSLPAVTYEKIETMKGFESSYKIYIDQPLDHDNPGRGTFAQKMYLNHKSQDEDIVVVTEGYLAPRNYLYELTAITESNQLVVEHRYFGESQPEKHNWEYLDTKQAAHDHLRIINLFRDYYTRKFIASGISKGGQTTLFLKYYYPDLVDVSVPYVAPINLMQEEPRIHLFLEMVGERECRTKIKEFQRLALSRRDSLLPMLKEFVEEKDLTYEILEFEKAFEYQVLEYPFSFWQWGWKEYEDIPDESASNQEIFDHLQRVIGIDGYSDEDLLPIISFYVQAYNEIGYYNYDISYLKDLLKVTTNATNEILVPKTYVLNYDPELMPKMVYFLEREADNVLYLYGEYDTWSASQVPVTGLTNSVKIIKPEGHHTTRFLNLNEKEQKIAAETLSRWLEREIKIGKGKL
ncbi:MAG: tripeptidyl aminopeptidase [Melioribacteraceae bacterium]|nr:MAG: tripeptidyl aminopeptidase [Melioribacteraceae bacterium]